MTLRHSAYTWWAIRKPVRSAVHTLTRPIAPFINRLGSGNRPRPDRRPASKPTDGRCPYRLGRWAHGPASLPRHADDQ